MVKSEDIATVSKLFDFSLMFLSAIRVTYLDILGVQGVQAL